MTEWGHREEKEKVGELDFFQIVPGLKIVLSWLSFLSQLTAAEPTQTNEKRDTLIQKDTQTHILSEK